MILAPKYKTLIAYAYEGVYETMLEKVCGEMNVPVEAAKSKSHKREFAEARMIFFKLANDLKPFNISMIGRTVNRSHSVVYDGIKAVDSVRELKDKYNKISITL
jgi:chromosomal replication initiation ATPase DnaA